MTTASDAAHELPLLPVSEHERAAALLDPLRRRILEHAREPASASQIARQIDLPRQRVNYHVRELARLGFLREFDRRRKRNMIEQRYIASARAYVLDPGLLGSLAAEPGQVRDRISASHLLALAARMQSEVIRAAGAADQQDRRLPTLGMSAELHFESAEQRREFAEALQQAVTELIARHASPACRTDGSPGPGRPYRLTVGCHPIPSEPSAGDEPPARKHRGDRNDGLETIAPEETPVKEPEETPAKEGETP